MQEGRWTTVTQSEFDHERRGLDAIRTRLPDVGPWYSWSNFTFTASTGHVREVDLLVVAPSGVLMVELKEWHGLLTAENGTWVQTTPSGVRRPLGNALHLVNRKAKEPAGLLAQNSKGVWAGEAVCLTDDSLHVRLPSHDQNGVYKVAELPAMLEQPARDERNRITEQGAREIKAEWERVGIRRSDVEYKVGPYLLGRRSFDIGPMWADYLARHLAAAALGAGGAAEAATVVSAAAPQKDPLYAVTEDDLLGRWEALRRLGAGSTSRAFLVRDVSMTGDVKRASQGARWVRELAVSKVVLTDSRGGLRA